MIRATIALLTMISLSSFASESTCDGHWQVQLDSNKVEYKKENGVSAWIPGVVKVSGELRQCTNTLGLKPVGANRVFLRGPGHQLNGQLMSSDYQALYSAHGGEYQLPLHPSGITHFWLRLPSAGFSPAGDYNGRLKAQFLRRDLSPPSFVEMNYHSTPVVSLRVPTTLQPWLSKSGHHYRVDMGEMSQGSQRNITLAMRSNASVTVRVDSLHGQLKHKTLPNQFIEYSLTLNGQSWDPKSTFLHEIGPLQSSRYTQVPFSINVAPQPKAYAGQYSDRLTITIMAK